MIRWVKSVERGMETLEKEGNEYIMELPLEDVGKMKVKRSKGTIGC